MTGYEQLTKEIKQDLYWLAELRQQATKQDLKHTQQNIDQLTTHLHILLSYVHQLRVSARQPAGYTRVGDIIDGLHIN